MVPTKNMPLRGLRARLGLIGLVLGALIGGCATSGTSLVECPLSSEQQQQAVLEIVPRGTTRANAEERLRKAGIEFSPGQKDSIYYLGLWKRADGKRWHIKVALLFDQEGKLYQTRPADSATQPLAKNAQTDASWPEANSTTSDSTAANSRNAGGTARTVGDSGTVRDDELYQPWPDQVDSKAGRR